MRLAAFRVYKFRNIEDSGEIELLDSLTCVIGKNQSGKSALLRALHKFNPHRPDSYDMRRDWPRAQRTERDPNHVVCQARLTLSPKDLTSLSEIAGRALGQSISCVRVERDYAGTFTFQFDADLGLFADPLASQLLDAFPPLLETPPTIMPEEIGSFIIKCNELLRDNVVARDRDALLAICNSYSEELTSRLPNPDALLPPLPYNLFIENYVTALDELQTGLVCFGKAHDYIVGALPTFIYMDDYKTFRGRADLTEIQGGAQDPENLSEEHETVLMLLRLAELDLDRLIEQGGSSDQNVLHDRQMDLEDAAKTLTDRIAGRWGQTEYKVQFRADGRVFFTEIEETKRNIGMIPLEEQSKGFQWFFSFDLHFMHDSGGTFENCVLLLDEPGLHLHPGGQDDLLKRLDAYSERNTLIYTTHLPFLVDLREPTRIKVIKHTDDGAVVSDDLASTNTDERLVLQSALGMRAHQSYLVAEENLVVEGVHDYWILAALANILEREDGPLLPEGVIISAAGGASKIVPLATFMIGQNLSVVALFDSDKAGKIAEKQLRERWITKYKESRAKTLLLGTVFEDAGKVVTIEDVFPEQYYLERAEEAHGDQLRRKGVSFPKLNTNGSEPILVRLCRAFERRDMKFNKGSVAKLIRRDLIKCRAIEELPDGLAKRAKMLLTAVCDAFENPGERVNSGRATDKK